MCKFSGVFQPTVVLEASIQKGNLELTVEVLGSFVLVLRLRQTKHSIMVATPWWMSLDGCHWSSQSIWTYTASSPPKVAQGSVRWSLRYSTLQCNYWEGSFKARSPQYHLSYTRITYLNSVQVVQLLGLSHGGSCQWYWSNRPHRESCCLWWRIHCSVMSVAQNLIAATFQRHTSMPCKACCIGIKIAANRLSPINAVLI